MAIVYYSCGSTDLTCICIPFMCVLYGIWNLLKAYCALKSYLCKYEFLVALNYVTADICFRVR